MKLLIKGGRIVDPASRIDGIFDILIEKGKIVDIKSKIETQSAKSINASNLIVSPGFIDMHVHLREPGKKIKKQ